MTTTTYLELDDQATGANNNTWGDVADSNMTILEQAIARYLGLSTTGGTTVLTSSQNRYPIIKVTGVLSSNATIQVRTAEKNWTFINGTTGNYTVTVKTSGGTGKTLPRGRAVKLYCDGTNVEYARFPGIPAAQAGGTVDAITATFEPATVAAELQDGTIWCVEAAGANTSTTPTFNPDSTGALTIKKFGGQALAVGDIRGAGHKCLFQYDASGGHVELLNPITYPLASNAEVQTGTEAAKVVTPAGLTAKEATVSDYRANVADRILTTDIVYSAAAEVTISYTATTTIDFSTLINGIITLNGNVTFANPSNQAGSVGKSGHIRIVQDATGSRTASWGSNWLFNSGVDAVLSTAANATDILYYKILANGVIHASLNKAIA